MRYTGFQQTVLSSPVAGLRCGTAASFALLSFCFAEVSQGDRAKALSKKVSSTLIV